MAQAKAIKQKQKPYFESNLSHIETRRSPGTVAVSEPVASPHLADVPDVAISISLTNQIECKKSIKISV